MSLGRELRKGLSWLFRDPREQDRLRKLDQQMQFLYRYLGLEPGERQYVFDYSQVVSDHIERYRFAARYLRESDNVLDAACGVGYGSKLMAEESGAHITGLDISRSAIQVAERIWHHDRVVFAQADCTCTGLPVRSADCIVSFETLEHVPDGNALLAHFSDLLRENGRLLISTPNETLNPHVPERNRFHFRHYTPEQLTALLTEHGFRVDSLHCQKSSSEGAVLEGVEGRMLIAVATRTTL